MGDKLWPTFKNSQCQLNQLLKVPLGSLLLHNELTDNTWSMLHVLNISCLHTSLEFLPVHIARNNDTCFRNICFRKELDKNARTHFSSPQASTSVWNNCRDQEVEFDWMHMFQAVTEHFETFFLANQRQQKQFFLQLEICMRKVCVLKISQSRLQQQQQLKEL